MENQKCKTMEHEMGSGADGLAQGRVEGLGLQADGLYFDCKGT